MWLDHRRRGRGDTRLLGPLLFVRQGLHGPAFALNRIAIRYNQTVRTVTNLVKNNESSSHLEVRYDEMWLPQKVDSLGVERVAETGKCLQDMRFYVKSWDNEESR